MADVVITNARTGEKEEHDFTVEDLERRQAVASTQAESEALQAAHEAALESGRSKLLALGLTEDEVAAMTNG